MLFGSRAVEPMPRRFRLEVHDGAIQMLRLGCSLVKTCDKVLTQSFQRGSFSASSRRAARPTNMIRGVLVLHTHKTPRLE